MKQKTTRKVLYEYNALLIQSSIEVIIVKKGFATNKHKPTAQI